MANRKDGSIASAASCAARLNSVSDVRDIARRVFECEFSWFDPYDPLIVEGEFPELRVLYVCSKATVADQRTYVDCRFHFDSRQVWIGSIQVATCHRLRGVGRQLVKAAEVIANTLGMEKVILLSRPSSVGFWQKLDYGPDPRSARIWWKDAAESTANPTRRRANSLRMSHPRANTAEGTVQK